MSNIYYLNTDFDLSMGGPLLSKYKSMMNQMSSFFIPCAGKNDAVYLNTIVPDYYLDYLSAVGFEIPSIIYAPGLKLDGVPFSIQKYRCEENVKYDKTKVWGWTKQALDNVSPFTGNHNHPDFDVVKKVNSKVFSTAIAQELSFAPVRYICEKISEVEKVLKTIDKPVVIKPVYGSSAAGFIRKSDDSLSAKEIGILERDLSIGEVIVEPWVNRIADFSVNFFVNKNKPLKSFTYQIISCSHNGTVMGITLFPKNIMPEISPELEKCINVCYDKLQKSGYYGYAGIDGYQFIENKKILTNPLSEINARYTMSYVAKKIRKRVNSNFTMTMDLISNLNTSLNPRMWLEDMLLDYKQNGNMIIASPPEFIENGKIIKARKVAVCNFMPIKQSEP